LSFKPKFADDSQLNPSAAQRLQQAELIIFDSFPVEDFA
jgi:hypothetical protein